MKTWGGGGGFCHEEKQLFAAWFNERACDLQVPDHRELHPTGGENQTDEPRCVRWRWGRLDAQTPRQQKVSSLPVLRKDVIGPAWQKQIVNLCGKNTAMWLDH